jgi:Tfp pilus assembly protein PilO
MRLFGRIVREKRAWILPLAVALAVNVAATGAVVYPLRVRTEAAARRAAAARQNLDAARRAYQAVRQNLVSKTEADRALRRFYTEILPADLAAARRLSNARLVQLAEQSRLRFERRSITTEPPKEAGLAHLRMSMVLAGEYRDIRNFLYRLETAPEFMVIEHVALAQSADRSGTLVLTIEVSTYYRPADHGS